MIDDQFILNAPNKFQSKESIESIFDDLNAVTDKKSLSRFMSIHFMKYLGDDLYHEFLNDMADVDQDCVKLDLIKNIIMCALILGFMSLDKLVSMYLGSKTKMFSEGFSNDGSKQVLTSISMYVSEMCLKVILLRNFITQKNISSNSLYMHLWCRNVYLPNLKGLYSIRDGEVKFAEKMEEDLFHQSYIFFQQNTALSAQLRSVRNLKLTDYSAYEIQLVEYLQNLYEIKNDCGDDDFDYDESFRKYADGAFDFDQCYSRIEGLMYNLAVKK